MAQSQFRFVTWNLKYTTSEQSYRARWEFLKTSVEWDVIALQEVSAAAWRYFLAQGVDCHGFCTLDPAFGLPKPNHQRPSYVALLARHGFTLDQASLIPDLPDVAFPELHKPERGLLARLQGLSEPITVVSWHAPHAADGQWRTKNRWYELLTRWLQTAGGALILGCDANNWNRSTKLALLKPPTNEKDRWWWQHWFFSCQPKHRLRDAFIDYLCQHPDEHAKRKAERPDGPLAVTHIRGNGKRRTPDRFDYIMISEEVMVLNCAHEFEIPTSKQVGSDHGLVTADLALGGSVRPWCVSQQDQDALLPVDHLNS